MIENFVLRLPDNKGTAVLFDIFEAGIKIRMSLVLKVILCGVPGVGGIVNVAYDAAAASRAHLYAAVYRCSPHIFNIVPVAFLRGKINTVIGIYKGGVDNINIFALSPYREGKGNHGI